LFGIDFITLMLVVISGFITLAYYQRSWRAICYAALLLTAPLLLQWVQWTTIDNRRQVSVALIQGNTDQALKWSRTHLEQIIKTYVSLANAHLGQQQIVILPEAAIPDIELNQQPLLTYLDSLSRDKNSALVMGIMNYEPVKRA